jgi:hypothetical protein
MFPFGSDAVVIINRAIAARALSAGCNHSPALLRRPEQASTVSLQFSFTHI